MWVDQCGPIDLPTMTYFGEEMARRMDENRLWLSAHHKVKVVSAAHALPHLRAPQFGAAPEAGRRLANIAEFFSRHRRTG